MIDHAPIRRERAVHPIRPSSQRHANWLILFLLLGAGLRLHHLGDKSLWLDEAFTWIYAESSWPDYLRATLETIAQVPLYYTTLRLVVPFIGLSEFSLRQTSVWASLLTIAVFYQVGRALYDRRVGLIAAGLLVVSPFSVWYAQDARDYSLYLLAATCALWGFWRAIHGKGWGMFTGASMALYITHVVGGTLLYVQALFLSSAMRRPLPGIFDWRRVFRRWALAQGIAVVPLAAWVGAILSLKLPMASLAWIPATEFFDPLRTLWNFLSGDADRWTPAVLAAPLFLGLLIWGVRHTPPPARALLLWWMLLPMGIAWVAGLRLKVFVDRYFIPALAAQYLFLAVGAVSLPRRWGMIAPSAAAALMLFLSLRIYCDPDYAKEDWRSAAAYLRASDSTIAVAAGEPVIALIPYMRADLKGRLVLVTQPEDITRYAQAGRLDLVFLSSLDSKHRLSKTRPFDPLVHGPPVFLQWRATHPETPITVLAYTGVAIVRIGPPPVEDPQQGEAYP